MICGLLTLCPLPYAPCPRSVQRSRLVYREFLLSAVSYELPPCPLGNQMGAKKHLRVQRIPRITRDETVDDIQDFPGQFRPGAELF